jgi:acyl-CoA synthetase (AMP-forming)/AMP-acid ligase II
VPEVEVAVIPITDEPIPTWDESLRLPPGRIGEIAVRGPFVTRAYHGRPQATASAKMVSGGVVRGEWSEAHHAPRTTHHAPRTTIWHRMGDVGYLDDRGRLWFCGRKAHRVTTAGGTLFTIPCEAVFNTHPAVYRTALVGVGPAGLQTPVLCVELEPTARSSDRAELTRELLTIGAGHEHTRGITTVLFHSAFPVDVRHNAKIFREKLAAWAARRVAK